MLEYAYLIALLPALSFPINLMRKWKEPLPAYIGLALVGTAWLWSMAIFFATLGNPEAHGARVIWIPNTPVDLEVGFQIDHMTTMMLIIVTTTHVRTLLLDSGGFRRWTWTSVLSATSARRHAPRSAFTSKI
jgi:hypothetical protein